MPWWESRGGVGITGYFNIQEMSTRPATYKKSQQKLFEKNKIMFRPYLNTFIDL